MKNTPISPSKGRAHKRPLSRKKTQFGNLAIRYYPGHGYKRAVALFRSEIVLTRGLLDALKILGYQERQRQLTPRQVKVIAEYLGEP